MEFEPIALGRQVILANGDRFATVDIGFDANAATTESALETAATSASITNWTNGDITVAGGDLNTAPSRSPSTAIASINHVDDGSLTGRGSAGAVSQTSTGAGGLIRQI